MARLKNRQVQIPSGLKFREPVTNWRARPFTSFDMIVQQLIGVCQGNPALAQRHGWSCDYDYWARRVDEFNTLVCQKMGWNDYITEGEIEGGSPAPVPFSVRATPRLSQNYNSSLPSPKEGAVVAGVKNVAAGVALIADWLGEELIPVETALAVERAQVCVKCPLNQDPNWLQRLTGAAAEGVRTLMGVRNQMELKTPFDAKLHTCVACECYLPLKVWAQLDHIKANMRDEVRGKLDPACWIRHEGKK